MSLKQPNNTNLGASEEMSMDDMDVSSDIDPLLRIKKNKILYCKERKAGLRTGKNWLESRVSGLSKIIFLQSQHSCDQGILIIKIF